jgi:hypothetical protein
MRRIICTDPNLVSHDLARRRSPSNEDGIEPLPSRQLISTVNSTGVDTFLIYRRRRHDRMFNFCCGGAAM